MKFFRYLLLFIQAILTIATILALASPLIPPSMYYWPAIMALLLPFLMLAQILFFLYWLINWDWPALIALSILVVSIPAIDRMIQIGYSSNVQDAEAFQLLSYNIHKVKGEENSSEVQSYGEEWQEFSRSVDEFDILALQECNRNAQEFIERTGNYAHEIYCDRRPTIRLYTDFTIVDNGCINLQEDNYNQALWADIKLPADKTPDGKVDTIRLYNVHLASNRISSITANMAEDMEIDPDMMYRDVRSMFVLYKNQAPRRVVEIKTILQHSLKTTHPTIICGDFNETPQSRVYRLVTDRFDDAFVEKGSGMSTTYAGYLPFLRIDYIFYTEQLKCIYYKRGEVISLSDHYPITASIKVVE